MPFALALFQAGSETSQDQTLYIILGVITLATLVALGLRFLTNMRDVFVAPAASMGHLGRTDNFFFSLFVVFLGGLIGLFGMMPRKMELINAFASYAAKVTGDIAAGNSNAIYRGNAAQWGADVMQSNFTIYGIENLIFFPIVMVILWLIVGTVCYWGGAKIFGTGARYSDFLGSLAYGSFFASIGLGFVSVFAIQYLEGSVGGTTPSPDVLAIIGMILLFYALILFLMGISQAAELASGQVVFALVILLIILGGATYAVIYMTTEPWEAFESAIRSYDPSKGPY